MGPWGLRGRERGRKRARICAGVGGNRSRDTVVRLGPEYCSVRGKVRGEDALHSPETRVTIPFPPLPGRGNYLVKVFL